MEVLMDWMTKEGNYDRWRGSGPNNNRGEMKRAVCTEISGLIKAAGIDVPRKWEDVWGKITYLEKSYKEAKYNRRGTGYGSRDGSSLQKKLKREFIYFDVLAPILENRPSMNPLYTTDDLETSTAVSRASIGRRSRTRNSRDGKNDDEEDDRSTNNTTTKKNKNNDDKKNDDDDDEGDDDINNDDNTSDSNKQDDKTESAGDNEDNDDDDEDYNDDSDDGGGKIAAVDDSSSRKRSNTSSVDNIDGENENNNNNQNENGDGVNETVGNDQTVKCVIALPGIVVFAICRWLV